ncbi:hypothetical protein FUAX_41860 (plasmid) [Fulvitalea axinellae]|uniref:6-bladed beta-propeller n=1 Tax=Fulvitalea axinellae TaxID=1182444 RepID=A0AAU9CZ24_9BACT|nr:hypothetical protein FUAX_41860 [Fulvitalea axinellae]
MRFLLIAVIFFLCLSCTEEKPTHRNLLDEFAKQIEVKTKLEHHFSDSLGKPMKVIARGQVVIIQEKMGDHHFSLFTKKGKLLRKFGKKGRGPEEISHPNSLEFLNDQTLMVYDSRRRNLILFSMDSLLEGSNRYVSQVLDFSSRDAEDPYRYRSLTHLKSGIFVGECVSERGELGLSNKEGETMKIVRPPRSIPVELEQQNVAIKSLIFQHRI